MAEAGTVAIFRIDANGEFEADAKTANQLIEFNDDAEEPDGNGHVESVDVEYIEDISIHSNPGRHLNHIQANKLGTWIIRVKGFFEDPNNAGGLTLFKTWMTQDKDSSALPYGRFGFRDSNVTNLSVSPTDQFGLILQNVKVIDVPEFENRVDFEFVLYRNGSV
jgi:hypothetical protein